MAVDLAGWIIILPSWLASRLNIVAKPHMPRKRTSPSIASGLVLLPLVIFAISAASAGETGRIRRHRPSPSEAARQLSEAVMNDDSLQVGDIIVTDRGYFVFEGVGEDGFTNKFRAVAEPLAGSVSPAVTSKRQAR